MKIAGCVLLVLGGLVFLASLAIGAFAVWCLTIPSEDAGSAFIAVATIGAVVLGVALLLLIPGSVLWLIGRKR